MIKIFSSKTRWFIVLLLAAALLFSCNMFNSDDDDDDDDTSSQSSANLTGTYSIDGETYIVTNNGVTNSSGESVGNVNGGVISISFESDGSTITITINGDGSIVYKITAGNTTTTYTGTLESGTLTNTANPSDTKTATKSDYTIVTDFASGTTVWTGNQVFSCDENCNNWAGNVTVRFHGVCAGDQILITHEANSYTSLGWKTLKIAGYRQWDDKQLSLDGKLINSNLGGSSTDKTLDVYSASQTTGIVLSEKDAEIINTYRGITLWGIGVTIKKIVVVSSGVTGIASERAKNGWKFYAELRNFNYSDDCKYYCIIRLTNEFVDRSSLGELAWINSAYQLSYGGWCTDDGTKVVSEYFHRTNYSVGTADDADAYLNDGYYIKESYVLLGDLKATYSADDMTITFTKLPNELATYLDTNTAYALESLYEE
ncbi:MAG: hypothetical protein II811_01815 [Spirochaetaceae bacterium]|nr:hypothetical protein [Spirochaetaceae bacterium]